MDNAATEQPCTLLYDGLICLDAKKPSQTESAQQLASDIAQLSTIRQNEYRAAQPSANSPQQHPQQKHSRASWQPPTLDLYKINYDGATFDSENMSGIGVVI